MKKGLLLFFLFFLSFGTQAQNKEWTKAKVYLKTGEILEGHARMFITITNQEQVFLNFTGKDYLRYINLDLKQRRSEKISPEEVEKAVLDVSYKSKGRKFIRKVAYIPVIVSKKNKKIKLGFAELVIDGSIKLIRRPVLNNATKVVYDGDFVIRENEQAILLYTSGFRPFKKRASQYFKDCPIIVSRIESKRYKSKDLPLIVNYYNDNCAK